MNGNSERGRDGEETNDQQGREPPGAERGGTAAGEGVSRALPPGSAPVSGQASALSWTLDCVDGSTATGEA